MTNRNRNIALIIGFFVAILICYQLAFSKTFELKSEYQKLSNEYLLFQNIPKQLSILKQKEQFYDSLLTINQLKDSSIQNSLLNTINNYAQTNTLKVSSFLKPHVNIKNEELTIKTYQFILEGDYNTIINLIYHLEQKTKFGEIINLQFEKKKNFKTGNYFLQASVLLKSLE